MTTLGERIKARRKELKLTTQRLAELSGCGRSTITSWENGRGLPHVAGLVGLCYGLGVSADYLIGLKEPT
jgi:transcriptional regulator with XRE-family HTH domain